MGVTRHAFLGEADMPRIFDLVRAMPLACCHRIDLPWRLSSPTISEGRDAVFWEDSEGVVVGFAAWQYYWAALDFFLLPGREAEQVETDLFAWAAERFKERDVERGRPLPYWGEFRDDDQELRQLFARHGFLLDEHARSAVLQRSLVDLAPVPPLPDGFVLRTLRGELDAAACAELHCAAFESNSMTPEWRARVMRTPQYRSDLDLVIQHSDGSLAGYCLGWFEPEQRVAQIEPIGVHPRFHRQGLGRVLLLEMLHRFKACGAINAIIEPYHDNIPIVRACTSVGFQQVHTVKAVGKWFNQPA